MIFDVRRGSTEDGPGVRTTVFFKGCNLRCRWCHNPESIDAQEEIGFYPQACIACGECLRACPVSACRMDNPLRIERALCTRCGACTDTCPANGLRRVGHRYFSEELIELLILDEPFYRASGGGVTLSGGEPTLHMEYAGDILRRLKERGIHTAIETNGLFSWERFSEAILPHVDLIMMDVKLADPEKHCEYAGASNDSILENLRRMARECPSRLLPRIPLIPGFTATAENLNAIASLFRALAIERYALLPYNPTWFHKARAIGVPIDTRLSETMPAPAENASWSDLFNAGCVSSNPSCAQTSRARRTKAKRGKRNGRRGLDDTDSEQILSIQA